MDHFTVSKYNRLQKLMIWRVVRYNNIKAETAFKKLNIKKKLNRRKRNLGTETRGTLKTS